MRKVYISTVTCLGILALVGYSTSQNSEAKNSRQASPPPVRNITIYTDENLGAGNRLFAGFNSNAYNLASVRYLAKPEWAVGAPSEYYACTPVGAGVAQPACPSPVSEVGMDGVDDKTLPDGTRMIGVNVQPAVANRHWRVRIELNLVPRP
jgi:hypothetical protein